MHPWTLRPGSRPFRARICCSSCVRDPAPAPKQGPYGAYESTGA